MKSLTLVALALAALIPAAAASAQEDLARRNGCLNCHNVQAGGRRMPASSLQEIAAANKGKADAEDRLTAALVGAKGHPPVRGNADDTRAIVKWMLTL